MGEGRFLPPTGSAFLSDRSETQISETCAVNTQSPFLALPFVFFCIFCIFLYSSHRVLVILLDDYDARGLIERVFGQGTVFWGFRS